MCGLWVRNGLQIKGQAMTYIQCHFCKSMVDADLFLLQVCATQLPTKQFLSNVIESFGIQDWLSFAPNGARGGRHSRANKRVYRDSEQEVSGTSSVMKRVRMGIRQRTNKRVYRDSEQEVSDTSKYFLCLEKELPSSKNYFLCQKTNT